MNEGQVLDASPESNDVTDENIAEKKFTRDQLAKIVKAESAKAADSARREAEAKYQRDLENMHASRTPSESGNADTSSESDDEMYQKVTQRLHKELQEKQSKDHVTQVAQTYQSRIDSGKSAYEDFDEVTKDFDPAAYPELTYLLAHLDNPAGVVREISKNTSKLIELGELSKKMPRMAHSKLLSLSSSIKDNEQAVADAKSNGGPPPLDRLQPSRVSGSNEKMGIRDLRSQDYLRG